MFSIIATIFDPFDRLVLSGAVQRAINSVLTLQGDFELILVSNNPIAKCPHLTQYLRSLPSIYPNNVKLMETNENRGCSGGFNAGMQITQPGSRYLVFMSGDAEIVDPGMLVRIQGAFDLNPDLGIAHPISVYEDSDLFNFSSRYGSRMVYKAVRERRPLDGAELTEPEIQHILSHVTSRRGITEPCPTTPLTFAVYRRDMLEQIGSFDEGFLACHENNDISYRALLAGFKVARLDGVFINHRRLIFRDLVVGGTAEVGAMPHSQVIGQSTAFWTKKWGRPYIELYAKWRWGAFLFSVMLPAFWIRRFGGHIKRLSRR